MKRMNKAKALAFLMSNKAYVPAPLPAILLVWEKVRVQTAFSTGKIIMELLGKVSRPTVISSLHQLKNAGILRKVGWGTYEVIKTEKDFSI